jgi:hypothetical protein
MGIEVTTEELLRQAEQSFYLDNPLKLFNRKISYLWKNSWGAAVIGSLGLQA